MQIRHQHKDSENEVPSTRNSPGLAVVIAGAAIAMACITMEIGPSDAFAGEEATQQADRDRDKSGLSPKMFDVDGGAGWAAGELQAYLKSKLRMAAATSARKEDSGASPMPAGTRHGMLRFR